MRVMLMIKGDPEPGAAPSEELLAAMGRYNDELKQAGVLLDLAGLLPSAEGRRVRFSGGERSVVDGPFAESKTLIAGYWILQVKSMDEAVEWAERFPFEAFSQIYPASTVPRVRSRSVRCSRWRGSTGRRHDLTGPRYGQMLTLSVRDREFPPSTTPSGT
jgi:hypothetical protein